MLDYVTANEYITEVIEKAGANQPLIFNVTSRTGEQFDAYVKLTDKLPMGIKGLIIEAFSSFLATDLGLITPSPCVVSISDAFIETMEIISPNVAGRLRNSSKETFGTKALPAGSKEVFRDFPIDDAQLQAAANIFAFDALIENPDRGGNQQQKPNCLINGDEFFVFDHEKGFANEAGIPILFRKLPWHPNGLNHYATPGSHLFINQLKKKSNLLNFSPFVLKWKLLTDERLDAYIGVLPETWVYETANKECAAKIIGFLKNIRENIDSAIIELERILR